MRAQCRVCLSYSCQSKGKKYYVTVEATLVYWVLFLLHRQFCCKPKPEQAVSCNCISTWKSSVWMFSFTWSQAFDLILKGKCFSSGGTVDFYFLFLIWDEVFIVHMSLVMFWEIQACLSIGQLGICFPEGFDLSSMHSYSPVQSSQWKSWENVHLLFIMRVQLSFCLFGHFWGGSCNTKSSDWIVFETLSTDSWVPLFGGNQPFS